MEVILPNDVWNIIIRLCAVDDIKCLRYVNQKLYKLLIQWWKDYIRYHFIVEVDMVCGTFDDTDFDYIFEDLYLFKHDYVLLYHIDLPLTIYAANLPKYTRGGSAHHGTFIINVGRRALSLNFITTDNYTTLQFKWIKGNKYRAGCGWILNFLKEYFDDLYALMVGTPARSFHNNTI